MIKNFVIHTIIIIFIITIISLPDWIHHVEQLEHCACD